MKFLIHIGCILLMNVTLSSVSSAQEAQRPSQRSLATVLSKIQEKKAGRERLQDQHSFSRPGQPMPVAQSPAAVTAGQLRSRPVLRKPASMPAPSTLPSKQPFRVPPRPKRL